METTKAIIEALWNDEKIPGRMLRRAEKEIAALTAERDALKEALKKQTEITWRLFGAIPYGNNPYAIHYVETVTGNHDDLLAKLEAR